MPCRLMCMAAAWRFRIAEDPDRFTPSPGEITTFHPPGGPGISVDTHAYEDYFIPPYYDSLLAKLIAFGQDRKEAIARMQRALDFFVVEGISTSIPLHKRILRDPRFRTGNISTRFMEWLRVAEAKSLKSAAAAKAGKASAG